MIAALLFVVQWKANIQNSTPIILTNTFTLVYNPLHCMVQFYPVLTRNPGDDEPLNFIY